MQAPPQPPNGEGIRAVHRNRLTAGIFSQRQISAVARERTQESAAAAIKAQDGAH